MYKHVKLQLVAIKFMRILLVNPFLLISKVLIPSILILSVLIPSVLIPDVHGVELKQPIIRYDSIHRDVIGYHGMVVSQNDLASKVGHQVLSQGGNAIDAAVATGFALAVSLPRAGNLGGSGFMLVHMAQENKTFAFDFRSMAPLSRPDNKNRTKDGEINWQKLTFGPNASGVPGTVAGLYEVWQRYGSMPWEALLAPAIKMAEEGIIVSPDLSYVFGQASNVLKTYPSSAEVYFKSDGSLYAPGDLWIQKDLAWSLKQIQQNGADAFYKGALAKKILAAFASYDEHFKAEDLAAYKVRERVPVSTVYRGYKVTSMPPSSAGGITLLQMLNILSHFDLSSIPAGSSRHLHVLAETMKRAAANRRTYVGDPDFVDVPINTYISPQVGKNMAKEINLRKAQKVTNIEPVPMHEKESRDTTHYSVMDSNGNAVSTTYTLGYSFGSGFVAAGTGILFDNQLRNFYISKSEKGPNAYAPGKRMISTMTPSIVFNPDNSPYIVTGSPGGSRIINTILQLLVNVIDYKMSISDATHQPRINQGWNSQKLGLEKGFSPDTLLILKKMGHDMRFERSMGSTQSILYKDGVFFGAADPRRPNATALGLITLESGQYTKD